MDGIKEIRVNGAKIAEAQGRLEYVYNLIERRREEFNARAHAECLPMAAVRYVGQAFLVHAEAVPALLADDECRASLEHIGRNGARCGVVVLLYGDQDAIVAAASTTSPAVTAAIMEGRTLQMAPPGATLAVRLQAPTTAADAEFYTDALSAEVWAALALDDRAGLGRVFDHLRDLGEVPGGPTERRLIADSLRRVADTLLPGAGGMLPGGLIPCPLCFASPMLRPDEVPSHLVELHGNLAEGMRS